MSPVSEDVPDTLVENLSQLMAKNWKLVAVYLGFTRDHVSTFDSQNDSVSEKVIAMLSEWKRQQAKNATRSSLMKALVKAGRKDLADKVSITPVGELGEVKDRQAKTCESRVQL